MNKLSYVEARDKIWNAYFRDEIQPNDPAFCFCGTLNENHVDYWRSFSRKENGWYYAGHELQRMEDALFYGIRGVIKDDDAVLQGIMSMMDNYEDAIFAGMLAALEVLKQIHRERGEVIPEDEPLLTKRNLQTQAI